MVKHTTEELLAFAIELAKDAGDIMRRHFFAGDKGVEIKADRTQVTVADIEINNLVIQRVTQRFPEHGVRGEEESRFPERSCLWVCDPIDGTDAYIVGVPVAMFSLAYVVEGVPRVAVVYDPFQDRLFSASEGGGAFCNGSAIQVSAQPTLRGSRIGTRSSLNGVIRGINLFRALVEEGVNCKSLPGCVFQGSLVAMGSEDAYIFPGNNAHDVAAIKLIVEEAGGKVTDFWGNDQSYNDQIQGAVVTNGKIHEELMAVISRTEPHRYLGFIE